MSEVLHPVAHSFDRDNIKVMDERDMLSRYRDLLGFLLDSQHWRGAEW